MAVLKPQDLLHQARGVEESEVGWLRHKAVRFVASAATDPRDALDLLEALGLDPKEGVGEAPISYLSGKSTRQHPGGV